MYFGLTSFIGFLGRIEIGLDVIICEILKIDDTRRFYENLGLIFSLLFMRLF